MFNVCKPLFTDAAVLPGLGFPPELARIWSAETSRASPQGYMSPKTRPSLKHRVAIFVKLSSVPKTRSGSGSLSSVEANAYGAFSDPAFFRESCAACIDKASATFPDKHEGGHNVGLFWWRETPKTHSKHGKVQMVTRLPVEPIAEKCWLHSAVQHLRTETSAWLSQEKASSNRGHGLSQPENVMLLECRMCAIHEQDLSPFRLSYVHYFRGCHSKIMGLVILQLPECIAFFISNCKDAPLPRLVPQCA